jgi:hypothetical protein
MTNFELEAQFRRAVQKFAETLAEEDALEIPTIYQRWTPMQNYKVGKYIRYGENGVGDPQLYMVVQEHVSQEGWTPDETPSLYVAVGLNDGGYPVWSQPTGAHDAYNKGDIVDYNGVLYISIIDGNVWSPDVLPSAWEVYNE